MVVRGMYMVEDEVNLKVDEKRKPLVRQLGSVVATTAASHNYSPHQGKSGPISVLTSGKV